jgi:hypothetical protein
VFVSRGYPARVRLIADRRLYLASRRLADVLLRVLGSKGTYQKIVYDRGTRFSLAAQLRAIYNNPRK